MSFWEWLTIILAANATVAVILGFFLWITIHLMRKDMERDLEKFGWRKGGAGDKSKEQ